MRRILFALVLACTAVSAPTGCTTAPSARVAEGQSLKAVGQAAEAAVALSARLYAGGVITADQARAVIVTFDLRFQPAYRLAVAAVRADLNQPASPEVAALAGQLIALVASFQHPTP